MLLDVLNIFWELYLIYLSNFFNYSIIKWVWTIQMNEKDRITKFIRELIDNNEKKCKKWFINRK